jgi:hypothetical protein
MQQIAAEMPEEEKFWWEYGWVLGSPLERLSFQKARRKIENRPQAVQRPGAQRDARNFGRGLKAKELGQKKYPHSAD